jgi:anaerobic dimethyl sulfoxide reductase subunit B (iron-sulfur subunit)
MHCEDAPCLLACPTGAIHREAGTQVVGIDADLCIGCHSCSIACPFGVPRFGADGKMQKCDLCSERLTYGLEPACVRVCPTRALRQGSPNELSQSVERRVAERLAGES